MHHAQRHNRPMKNKAPLEPWWSKPGKFFYVPFGLFWMIVLYTWLQRQPLGILHDGLSKQDRVKVLCNPAHRSVATCAHRGNAAELLSKTGAADSASVLQQMELLWGAGVFCFDMDVIQLKGGDMIVGHPADLAAQVTASALSTSSSSKSISAEQLYGFTLEELRSAELTAAVAPTLQQVLDKFHDLLISSPLKSSSRESADAASTALPANVTVRQAAATRAWVQVPLISLEPKGPAATSAEAFMQVHKLAATAGISNHTVLWLRQMPLPPAVAAGGSGNVVEAAAAPDADVTTFAAGLKQQMKGNSQGRGRHSQEPLLGLIVTDVLLKQPHLSGVYKDASKLATALLATAGGASNRSNVTESEGAAAVVDAFDVLAPSIKLPPRVLQSFLARKPCLAWTLDRQAHIQKAMWLGMDVAITNTPMQQLDVIDNTQHSICV